MPWKFHRTVELSVYFSEARPYHGKMSNWQPWIDYPGITQGRLVAIADVVRRVRTEALFDHRPEYHETNWSLGVRQYERTEGALFWARQDFPWLTIVAGSTGGATQFVFAIGGHLIRFCRGDDASVALRYRMPCLPEIAQRQLFGPDARPGLWLRLVIDNEEDGRPGNIWLCEIDQDSGEPINSYLIPEIASNIATFSQPTEPPVNIPPVTAEAVDDVDEAQTSQDNG
jgi:hypothetical protein